MSKVELQVVNSVLKNKDMHVVLEQPIEIFSAYGDMIGFARDYYSEYKVVPSFDLVQEKFPDLEEVRVDSKTEHYVKQLKDEYLNSEIEQTMMRAADLLREHSASEVLQRLNGRLAHLSKFTESVNVIDLKEYDKAADYYREVANAIAEQGTGTLGIPSGFASIDASMPNGFEPGHLCYLAGYSGRGKSWFSGQITSRMWVKYKYPMLFVSLEMAPEAMRNRIYNMIGSGLFDMSSLAHGDLNYDDYNAWAKKSIADNPSYHIVSNENGQAITPNIIRGKIEQYKPKAVVVDYAQICSDNAGTVNMTEKMNNLAYEFKRLATSTGVVLFVVTAVKDDEGGKREAPPTPSQIMYSRSLEYSADSIFTVHRQTDTNILEVGAIKNRNGELFNFLMEVDFGTGVWKELEDQ